MFENVSVVANYRIKLSNFPIILFKRDIKKKYKSSKISHIFNQELLFFRKGTISIHYFFIPEMVYILNELNRPIYKKFISLILENSWIKDVDKKHTNRLNISRLKDIVYTLKNYQKNFLHIYDSKKQQYKLNGYILAFEQGIGKTITSLALMHCLNKQSVIIIAPKSILQSVWKNEIKTVFKNKYSVWTIGDKPQKSDFYLVNYESIDKLNLISKFISKKNGIIIDECHNFRNSLTKRVVDLEKFVKKIHCNDILLMSGTPIKAIGSEMIPALRLLDNFFDSEAEIIFKKVFGLKTEIALDIMKNRLGMMMHRKLKSEVFELPVKKYFEEKISIPNGKKYTLEEVKKQIASYITDRQEYYRQNYNLYLNDYNEVIEYLKNTKEGKTENFANYLKLITELKKSGYQFNNQEKVQRVKELNVYEKNVLRPLLPNELKKKFDKTRSVIKYVNLKIMGEVIGNLLTKLRSEMFNEMIVHSPLCKIINNSEKKTICFTTYVDVVKQCNDYLEKNCKMKPVKIFGETSSKIPKLINDYKNDKNTNPLIATIQTLSTGVTLTNANTIVFLNNPWRYVDKIQAEDRCHRIGQDTEVYIYTFVLDTGSKLNLSTRMEEIVSWSKNMFNGIVGEEEIEKNMRPIIKKLLGYIPS